MEAKIIFIFDLDGTILDTFNYFKQHTAIVMKKFNLAPDKNKIDELQKELTAMIAGKSLKG